MTNATLPESVLTKHQTKRFSKEFTDSDGTLCLIVAEVRYDDECGNGHNSFAITGELYDRDRNNGNTCKILSNGKKRWLGSCGCIHEEISKHLPELAPFLKYHLMSSDSPMHYIANTLYLAGDRDYNEHKAGDPCDFETLAYFGDFPIPFEFKKSFREYISNAGNFEGVTIEAVPHTDREGHKYADKFTYTGFACEWHECPFDSEAEAKGYLEAFKKYPVRFEKIATAFSKGKEREFDAARSAAAWPEATDEQLSAPREELEKVLIGRLPALVVEFKAAVESLGFVY